MSLASCSSCDLPVKLADAVCPHCGSAPRHSGRIGQAAILLMMGLTSAAGCSGSKQVAPNLPPPEYETPSGPPSSESAKPADEPPIAPSGQPSAPVNPPAAAYGVALTPSSSVSPPVPPPPAPKP